MNRLNSELRIKTPKTPAEIVKSMEEEVTREFPHAKWRAAYEEKCDNETNFCKTIYYYYLYDDYDEDGNQITYPNIKSVRIYQEALQKHLNQYAKKARNASTCMPEGCSVQGGRRRQSRRRRTARRRAKRMTRNTSL